MDLFKTLLPNLLQENNPIIFENENDYNPWMVNQALSYKLDCIFFAAEMNRNYNLDKKLQYDFLFHVIKKKKRPWTNWNKKDKSSDLEIIKQYYGYSLEKAKEVINILSKEQIQELKDSLDQGGSK